MSDHKHPGCPASLSGQTALVTGFRRGLGRSIAVGLARAGADLVGVSREVSETDSIIPEIKGLGRSVEVRKCDLSDRAATQRLLSDLDAANIEVDILVNNAGTIGRDRVEDMHQRAWDEQLEINLTSHFVLSRHFGALMARRGRGKIVSVASVLAFQGGMNVAAYVAAKSGLVGLTRALCVEWAPYGVNVNAVAPGYFETDMTRPLQEDDDRRESIARRIPAGRWGRPDELAGAVVFLASSAADYIHGAILPVDGGWLAK